MLQRQSIQKLHDNEPLAVMLRNLINRTDIGMVQGRCCAGLPAEAFQNLRVLGNVVRQKFQGDETTEHRILCLVDDTHAPAAQLLDSAVVRDGLADHWRESYVCETGKSMKAVELMELPFRMELAVSQKCVWRKSQFRTLGALRK